MCVMRKGLNLVEKEHNHTLNYNNDNNIIK